MRARWVLHNPSPEPMYVGYSIVAGWWPTTYRLVCTLALAQGFPDAPSAVLTRKFKDSSLGEKNVASAGHYETRVFRCDSNGWTKTREYVWFKRQYADLESARAGHGETVHLLVSGMLPLRRERLYPAPEA